MVSERLGQSGESEHSPLALTYARPGADRASPLRTVPNPIASYALVAAVAAAVLAAAAITAAVCRGTGRLWLVLGLPLLAAAVLATILGAVAVGRARRPGFTGGHRSAAALAISSLSLLVAAFFLIGHAERARANKVRCFNTLRSIGQGMLLYQSDNRRLPSGFADLIVNCDINPECFICPESDDTKAQGVTSEQMLAEFAKPGHCSYVYVGAAIRGPVQPSHVVAHEKLANHDGTGIHVLFANGAVQWIGAKTAAKVLAELAAGQNPPPSLSPPQPATERSR